MVRELGQGGMGKVYLGRDPSLERNVALKLLLRDAGHSALRAEAKALAALNHPGIVTIFEIGDHEGKEFIAMEYLPGRSLRQLMQPRMSREHAINCCARVALAVEAAHRAGILHRDIKPENIIVTDAGEVKVVDFGIAQRLAGAPRRPRAATAQEVADAFARTHPIGNITDTILSPGTNTVFGTPAYIAPEVLLGEVSSAASDVYSLGIVLYEVIAGRRPHDATNLAEMIAQVIEGTHRPLGDPLSPLVEAMLARDPAKRPDLVEVEEELARQTQTVVSSPPSSRRRMWLLIAGAVAIAAVVATLALTRQPSSQPPAVAPSPALKLAIAPLEVHVPS